MTLKDWKKKVYTFPDGKRQTIQFHKGNKILDIRPSYGKYSYDELWDGGKTKRVITKAQAITYAKAYMRKH